MKLLTEAAVRQYREQGYYAPIYVMPRQDAAALRGALEAFEAGGGPLAGDLRHKSHLLFTWLNDLIRHPRILDAVEDVIGPNLLCWGTSFFIKEPRNPGFVSWHQDSTYWGLIPPTS
jgi:non-heme Fe2+,alpha-ketoglutarate-dependent halogenase